MLREIPQCVKSPEEGKHSATRSGAKLVELLAWGIQSLLTTTHGPLKKALSGLWRVFWKEASVIYISLYIISISIIFYNSAEPINIGRRRVGRPRQQWLFRSNEIIHNRISHADLVWDHAKHRSIRMSCDCVRLNAWQWQEKKASIIIVYIILHNNT